MGRLWNNFQASPGPGLIWFQTLGCCCQKRLMPGPAVRGGVPVWAQPRALAQLGLSSSGAGVHLL